MNGPLQNGASTGDAVTPENALEGYLAITWSPNPKIFNGIKPEYQFYDTVGFFRQFYYCMEDYEIYPELNQNGNIHYHGVFKLKDKVKWYKIVLPKLKYNGFVLIKNNIDQKWLEYCKKDSVDMSKILKIALPLTRDNLKPTPKSQGTPRGEIAILDGLKSSSYFSYRP